MDLIALYSETTAIRVLTITEVTIWMTIRQ